MAVVKKFWPCARTHAKNQIICQFLLVLAIHACFARDENRYQFGACNYSVGATFTVLCCGDSVLSACSHYCHLDRFMSRSNLTITRLAEGKQWSKCLFAYSYVVYRCSLTIQYELKPDSNLVRFNLLDARPKTSLFPLVQGLSGSYGCVPVPGSDSVRVTYLQQTRMSKRLNILYKTEIRFETDGVIKRLKAYVEKLGRRAPACLVPTH